MKLDRSACRSPRSPAGWCLARKCRLLAPISSKLFEPKVFPYRPDRGCYVHNCPKQGKPPLVLPSRFMVTCEHGHLDDFPVGGIRSSVRGYEMRRLLYLCDESVPAAKPWTWAR
jgi:hypothetical protein